MAMALVLQAGRMVDYTPSSAVAAGDVVVQGDLVGVATSPIAANTKGALMVSGVVRATKPTGAGTDATAGTLFYWDVADSNAQETADSGTNKLIGVNVTACGTSDTTVDILLRQT